MSAREKALAQQLGAAIGEWLALNARDPTNLLVKTEPMNERQLCARLRELENPDLGLPTVKKWIGGKSFPAHRYLAYLEVWLGREMSVIDQHAASALADLKARNDAEYERLAARSGGSSDELRSQQARWRRGEKEA